MPLTVLEEKLLRLALDAAAQPGEAENAAVKLIQSLRARKLDGYDHGVKSAFSANTPPKYKAPPEPESPPGNWPEDWPGSVIMPFGKYQGKRLAEIDPSYFRWAVQNWEEDRRGDLMAAMRWLLEDLANKQRRRK